MSKKSPIKFPVKPPGQAKVWNVIEYVKKNSKEPPVKIFIQEIPEDRYEEILDHMCTYFLADEPICRSMQGVDDPEYVANFRSLWKEILHQGVSVGAFAEDPNGGKPIVAGCNVLGISFEGEHEEYDHFKSEKGKRITRVLNELCNEAGVYKKYGVDRYLSAIGLSVDPSYRGAALGAHILNAREKIGKEYNIPVTATMFTSPISQKLSERCGFEVLLARNYDDVLDEDGTPMFPGIQAKLVTVSAKRLF
ncbi:arylalkylamine N-acetyltransferase-like 2 [Colletes latitarsis]|uniref:arylalkylamine N-acetyltransferase-like 2 n=1 Tax=Colletes latitarsis TaxID=2605962 RepID=UPI004035E935